MKLITPWLIFGWLACGAPSSNTTESTTNATNHDMGKLLKLAEGASQNSRDAIASLAATSADSDARMAAKRIIATWQPNKGYVSKVPVPLRRGCVSPAALDTIRDRISVTTFVDVEVGVDSIGRVREIHVKHSSGDKALDRLVCDELRKARFLPAKPADVFADGSIRMSCWLEAR